ncbi:hypothetical protein FPOAC2_09879 [Fusarium poae]|jgi:hypothetical protein|uniref:hypothetical protein n=1 Tax=Fusarium poae TaxID=36050 RepID=UPI001CEA6104|nr:hypothetical protein FPOAC1_009938 [Fusarium poae]KAG8670517.1 hypothetical protein FPOAC1_009938 [Fusarium poae]
MAEMELQHFADRIVVGDERRPNPVARNLRDDADGTILVGQMRQAALMQIGTLIWLMINVELLSADWAFQFSIENESNGTRTKEETTEIGMNVSSGREVSNSVYASAGFTGFGFSAQVGGSTETKTFSTLETSSIRTVRDTYVCPPHSSIFVYKRRYKFRCRTWFLAPGVHAWVENPNGVKIESQFENEIIANQELISPVALTNIGRITNSNPSGLTLPTRGWKIDRNSPWQRWYEITRELYPWVR